MRIERSEVPFRFVKFELKARRHDQFKAWADSILAQQHLAQPDIGKFLEEVGVLRPI